ncbi:MAG TPA: YihY/virulence factor BrkB family protein, partial [Chloroflexota bacterium]|nr:YihY/virulence factor BrkB family protein [Chloroflexota bacterium]
AGVVSALVQGKKEATGKGGEPVKKLNVFGLIKESFSEWQRDKASRLAAALAYYTAFSIAPLLLLIISIAGLVLGQEAAQGTIFNQLQGLLGSEVAGFFQSAIAHSREPGASSISAVIGLATLIWSAGNVFGQLQDALDTIWEVQPAPAGLVGTVKRRIVPLTMVLGVGFLLMVSLVLSAGISAIGTFLGNVLPGSVAFWEIVNVALSLVVITLLFAAIFKILPDAEIRWSDVWVGAIVTSLLFVIGKTLIGIYLGHSTVGSTYGAAGSLLVFLVWVYYSAQILFFGAEFTQVYARQRGARIVPSPGAIPLQTEEKQEQGLKPTGAPTKQPAIVGVGPIATSSAVMTPAEPARDSGALKKLLWTGLSAASMAITGVLAHRMTTGIWRTVFHEPVPDRS